jgi:hypothetical protein
MVRALLIALMAIPFVLPAQTVPSITARQVTVQLQLDGRLDELEWQTAAPVSGFRQNWPSDTAPAQQQTTVRILYNQDYLYIGAVCTETTPGQYVVSSLKRDFEFDINDAFAIFLDPFNDQTNGYSFAVNTQGVQVEGLLVNGGSFGSSNDWDCRWFAETSIQDGQWVAEIAIPLRSIKYRADLPVWKINFGRNSLRSSEYSTWAPVPLAYPLQTLSFAGQLHFSNGPPAQVPNIALVPYAIGRLTDDYSDGDPARVTPNAGLDARFTVFRSLNLDLTINPDFSQVDVDQQVTNLSRFSLFFPERRNFFLENNDLFGMFGFSQIRPFFSRRIGLAYGSTVPILGGARLSGKINQNWRVGLMNMQTEGVAALGRNPENFTVATFQRRIGTRSSIGGIFVNRQGFSGNNISFSDYNRVAGVDYNLLSKNNRWMGKFFYHQSFTPGLKGNAMANASFLRYADNHWSVMWNHEYVGNNYRADVGFVPRIENYDPVNDVLDFRTFWRLEPEVTYTWFMKKGVLQSISHGLYLNSFYGPRLNTTESMVNANTTLLFRRQAELSLDVNQNFVLLIYPFDPSGLDSLALPAGGYAYTRGGFFFTSSPIPRFTYGGGADLGQYFNGTNTNLSAYASLRVQPFGSLGLEAEYNGIRLPQPYASANLWLVGPRIELAFTRSIFFTTFIQYNTQVENLNINARFQWRFKPMSDLFIVYTDNYDSRYMAIRNRALVIKFSYWFNL